MPRYTFFLAHAGADTDRARELYDRLVASGVATFLDAVDLLPGDEWDRRLSEAQSGAQATVALVSDQAEAAYYLLEEIATAIAYQRADRAGHRLIPVYLDGFPSDPTRIRYGLRRLHSLDAKQLGLDAVAAELRKLARSIGAAALPASPPLRRIDRNLLYDALHDLDHDQFDAVIFKLRAPEEMRAVRQLGRPERIVDLIQWAEVEGQASCDALEDLVRAHLRPERVALAAWLSNRRRMFSLVRVPGPNRDVTFNARDLVVPLQLQFHRRGRGDDDDRSSLKTPCDTESIKGDFKLAFALVAQRSPCLGLAIVGDPGSGKTTLLQQIFCEVHAVGSQTVGLPAGLAPVFIRCKTFESVKRDDWSFETVVAKQAAADGFANSAAILFSERRPLLLLCDGLDEVRDESLRVKVCDWLSREALAHRDHWCFVVTSRVATWHRASRLSDDFLTADVLSLDELTVRQYVENWFKAVKRRERLGEPISTLDEQALVQATALIEKLFAPERRRDKGLEELTGNPLSLALLCQVHTRQFDLPERRSELYEECLRVFLERRPKEQDRPFLPLTAARAVLQPLAWGMQLDGREDLSFDVMEQAAAPLLRRRPDLKSMSPEQFVRTAWHDCGIFRSRDFRTLAFFHAALREHLAATYAVEKGRLVELAQHVGEDRWRNVALLAMSLDGGFSGLAVALLAAHRLAAHLDILREGLRGAASLEPEPFVAALRAAAVHPTQRHGRMGSLLRAFSAGAEAEVSLDDVAAILDLFVGWDEPDVRDAARPLMDHGAPSVRTAARRLLAISEPAPREAAGQTPGQLWREPATGITFVWIPRGEFRMGNAPGRPVRIAQDFWIGQHPVTNEVYARFLAAAKHREPEFWRNARFKKPELPVVGVDYGDARAFCEWATAAAALEDALVITLPTEVQWEYTARSAGGDGKLRTYPWGEEEPTPERAVFHPSDGTAAVGGRPAGVTPLGVHDMAGNVWEWCLDAWQGELPGSTDPIVEAPPESAAPRVVRGGSWGSNPGRLRAAVRGWFGPGSRFDSLGFRVVCRGSRQHVGP